MRTLAKPADMVTACAVKGDCSIPGHLLADDHARLFRVDIFKEYGRLEHLAPVQMRKLIRGVTWVFGQAFNNGTLANVELLGCDIISSGTYDGFVLKVRDIDCIPLLPHEHLFHAVAITRTPFVLKIAIVGPALFHPLRVSSNISLITNAKKRAKSAIFNETSNFCL